MTGDGVQKGCCKDLRLRSTGGHSFNDLSAWDV